LQAYARYLAAQTPPVNLDTIVTRMKFDTKAESPKLFFSPVRWLDDDEYASAQRQGATKDADQAINMTVAQADGVSKPAPMSIGGSRPAAAPPAPAPEPEEEAPAPAKTKAKKAAPVADADDEPEVRKPEAKETAVPAKKSKLADIVADWDDE
jgi:hypothetical protein